MKISTARRVGMRAALALTAAALLPGCARPDKAAPPVAADAAHNFGFPLGFSPKKMDPAADPRQDFRRYAGGRWLDAAKVPDDKLEISGYLVVQETVQAPLRYLLQEAARTSGAAAKGSPTSVVLPWDTRRCRSTCARAPKTIARSRASRRRSAASSRGRSCGPTR